MQLREFIIAVMGTTAALALASQSLAQVTSGKQLQSYQANCTDCEWTASTTHGIDTVKLTFKGVCQEPTPGYTLNLTRVDLPGTDPSTLTLVLTVVAPTGIEPQHVTPTPVEYQQTFVLPKGHVPTKVTVFEVATTVNVNAP